MSLIAPAALKQTWQKLQPRERQLTLLAIVCILGTVLFNLYDWGAKTRSQLHRTLPQTQAALTRMQEDATELTRLKALPAPPAQTPPALKDAAQTAATARQLAIKVTLGTDGISFEGQAPLPGFVDWLASLQTDLRLSPTQLNFTPNAQSPHANVSGRLQTTSEGR